MISTSSNYPDDATSHRDSAAFASAAAEIASAAAKTAATDPRLDSETLLEIDVFLHTLVNTMRDGVIFTNASGQIRFWSQSTEVMTGMSCGRVVEQPMTPSLLSMSDMRGREIPDDECPLQQCLSTGKKKSGEYKIVGRSGRESKIEMTFAPVKHPNGTVQGAIVLLHDSSVQLDLKRQLQDLYAFSMLDPLTQVANRAEFERVLDEYVRAHQTSDFTCSIIVCDIDFFKSINDNYNHHIGDQALVSFAGLLKNFVRATGYRGPLWWRRVCDSLRRL